MTNASSFQGPPSPPPFHLVPLLSSKVTPITVPGYKNTKFLKPKKWKNYNSTKQFYIRQKLNKQNISIKSSIAQKNRYSTRIKMIIGQWLQQEKKKFSRNSLRFMLFLRGRQNWKRAYSSDIFLYIYIIFAYNLLSIINHYYKYKINC